MLSDRPIEFSEYLQDLLTARNMKVAGLAAKIGVDASLLYRWMRGEGLDKASNRLPIITRTLNLSTEERKMLFVAFKYSYDLAFAIKMDYLSMKLGQYVGKVLVFGGVLQEQNVPAGKGVNQN
jgi:hypothetical protein